MCATKSARKGFSSGLMERLWKTLKRAAKSLPKTLWKITALGGCGCRPAFLSSSSLGVLQKAIQQSTGFVMKIQEGRGSWLTNVQLDFEKFLEEDISIHIIEKHCRISSFAILQGNPVQKKKIIQLKSLLLRNIVWYYHFLSFSDSFPIKSCSLSNWKNLYIICRQDLT